MNRLGAQALRPSSCLLSSFVAHRVRHAWLVHELGEEQVQVSRRSILSVREGTLCTLHAAPFACWWLPAYLQTTLQCHTTHKSNASCTVYVDAHSSAAPTCCPTPQAAVEAGLGQLCPRADLLLAPGVALATAKGLSVRAWGLGTDEVRGEQLALRDIGLCLLASWLTDIAIIAI